MHTLSADYSGVRQGVELIRSFPDDKGIRGEKDNRMLLMAEESMGGFAEPGGVSMSGNLPKKSDHIS